jgi:biopolymer transport protein ExbD
MRQVMTNKDQREVFLRGDGGVQLQDLMDVMDRLKEGGVERVGIVSQPPPARRR